MLILVFDISEDIQSIDLRLKGLLPITVRPARAGAFKLDNLGKTTPIDAPCVISFTDEKIAALVRPYDRDTVGEIKACAIKMCDQEKKARRKLVCYRYAKLAVKKFLPQLSGSEFTKLVDTVRHSVENHAKRRRMRTRPHWEV